MNRRYRKTSIAGNWKMNKTATEAKKFADDFKALLPKTKWCDVVVCVPSVDISAAVRAFKDSRVAVGAQNLFYEDHGAYTGEVSAAVLNAGLNPIICVGESLDQREMDVTMELIALQVKSALAGVAAENIRRCVIAYEPIWAIGTGKTATGEQAAEVCGFIRATIRAMYGARIARSVTIQYGGSMNPANAAELLGHEDIDGGLIGGASLDAGKFMDIVNAANQG